MKIKVRTKLIPITLFATVIVFTAGISLYQLYSLRMDILNFVMYQQVHRLQLRLLCKTDHSALWEACRDLSRQVAKGQVKPYTYDHASDRSLKASRVPKLILHLEPTCVSVDTDGIATLEWMFGRSGYFGVRAFPENYKKVGDTPKYQGDRELVSGLWYFDDGYVHNPEYDKRIEKLLQRGK